MKDGLTIMAKKSVKYGKIELGPGEFRDENALIRISMMIPMVLYKDLKKLSLDEKYSGKYQVLIRDILTEYAEKQKGRKKKSA